MNGLHQIQNQMAAASTLVGEVVQLQAQTRDEVAFVNLQTSELYRLSDIKWAVEKALRDKLESEKIANEAVKILHDTQQTAYCKYVTDKAVSAWNIVAPYLGNSVTFALSLAATGYCTVKAIGAYSAIIPKAYDVYEESKRDYEFWRNRALAAGGLTAASAIAWYTNQSKV